MSEYTPDAWVLIELKDPDTGVPYRKVLAGWHALYTILVIIKFSCQSILIIYTISEVRMVGGEFLLITEENIESGCAA